MRIAITEDCQDDGICLISGISRWAAEHHIPLVPSPILYQSGEALLEHFSKGTYDIIFLDIFTEGMNGMETARRIRETDDACCLIFVTSSADYAVDSYDVNSAGYLLKPYNYQKLSQALTRCNTGLLEQNQSLTIAGKHGNLKLLLHQIMWTEYVNRQICVHLKDGSEQYIRMRQNEFASMLLTYPYFCDCMKGILVNFEFVKNIQERCFQLEDGHLLPISRLKYRDVHEKFLEYSYYDIRSRQSTQPDRIL